MKRAKFLLCAITTTATRTTIMATTENASNLREPISGLPEIDLEPTCVPDFETFASEQSQESPSVTSASMVNEISPLLRQRMLAIAVISAVVSTSRFAFSLFVPESGEGLSAMSLACRTLLAFAIAGLLASRRALSYRQLRAVEYFFIGMFTLMLISTQYTVGLELIARGDIARLVAFDKNTIIRLSLMMVMYGVLIPNRPQITARVVLTMATCPILVLTILLAQYAGSPLLEGFPGDELATSNSLFIVIAAGCAIAASYILNGMQSELHDARRLGQYQLGDKLGEGGMGEVYMAEHQLLKRPCALKLIKSGAASNPIALARFEREVQSAATLSHPNTIQIFDYGHTPDGTFYYVMELLSGLSVSELVEQFGPLPAGRAIYLMRQVCHSLQEAHHLGMVHRDLKPANIFVAILGGKCDMAKVLDFGLVKVADDGETPQLTAEYTVSGTPSYMSPEQAKGEREVDGRADIYALGAILYYMLTGSPPFEKSNPMALMIAHASEAVLPPSQREPSVPSDVEAIILRCLAKSPEERYPDTRSLAAALAECESSSEWNEMMAEEWWLNQAQSQSLESDLITAATTVTDR